MIAALTLVLSFLIDRALGEPPNAVHPVAWMGRAIARGPTRGERTVGEAFALLLDREERGPLQQPRALGEAERQGTS